MLTLCKEILSKSNINRKTEMKKCIAPNCFERELQLPRFSKKYLFSNRDISKINDRSMFVEAQSQTCQVQIKLYSVEWISRFVYSIII